MLFTLLLGCSDLLLLSDTVDDLTQPLVVQAFYVGMEPLPEALAAAEGDWSAGSKARVLLSEAAGISADDAPPITDAEVLMEYPDGELVLTNEGAGEWTADGDDGLAWHSDVEASLTIRRDEDSRITLTTPPAPELDIPSTLAAGEALELDLDGQPFDNLLVKVVRLADGVTVYDSTPEDSTDLYRLTHSASSLTATIAATVFEEPGEYAVGVAGLVNAHPDDYEGVNLALSALTAGTMVFTPVRVP